MAVFAAWNTLTLIPAKDRPAAVQIFRELPASDVALALDVLAQAPTPHRLEAAEQRAIAAYRSSPLAVEALGILALIAEERGDQSRAARILAHASSLTLHDEIANMARLRGAARRGNPDEIAKHADIVLRANPTTPGVAEALMIEAQNEAFADALARRLASTPPWRLRFLQALGREAKDQEAAYLVFLRLVNLGSAPSKEELWNYFMVGARSVDPIVLHERWIELQEVDHDASKELVYDGEFNGLLGTPPFNWRMNPSSGVDVRLSQLSDSVDDRELHIRYGADRRKVIAKQMILLRPSAYHLSFVAATSGATEEARVRSIIKCVNLNRTALISQEYEITRHEETYSSWFEVPIGCGAQWLEFEGMPDILARTSTYRIDDVRIRKNSNE